MLLGWWQLMQATGWAAPRWAWFDKAWRVVGNAPAEDTAAADGVGRCEPSGVMREQVGGEQKKE
jgi:hypothetical protein